MRVKAGRYLLGVLSRKMGETCWHVGRFGYGLIDRAPTMPCVPIHADSRVAFYERDESPETWNGFVHRRYEFFEVRA